jgi:hypothetical protein
MEERHQDEETMDNLDFEEISDEELDPEEARTGEPNPQTIPHHPPLYDVRLWSSGQRSGFDSRRYQIF